MFFFLTLRPPPTSTLFPYTTLFRSAPGSVSASAPAKGDTLAGKLPANHMGRIPVLEYHVIAGDKNSLYTRTAASLDRKSTRLNSSHVKISYAVFCLKKKKKKKHQRL